MGSWENDYIDSGKRSVCFKIIELIKLVKRIEFLVFLARAPLDLCVKLGYERTNKLEADLRFLKSVFKPSF